MSFNDVLMIILALCICVDILYIPFSIYDYYNSKKAEEKANNTWLSYKSINIIGVICFFLTLILGFYFYIIYKG